MCVTLLNLTNQPSYKVRVYSGKVRFIKTLRTPSVVLTKLSINLIFLIVPVCILQTPFEPCTLPFKIYKFYQIPKTHFIKIIMTTKIYKVRNKVQIGMDDLR